MSDAMIAREMRRLAASALALYELTRNSDSQDLRDVGHMAERVSVALSETADALEDVAPGEPLTQIAAREAAARESRLAQVARGAAAREASKREAKALPVPPVPPDLVTEWRLSLILDVNVRTLQRKRKAGQIPVSGYSGRRPLYDVAKVREALK